MPVSGFFRSLGLALIAFLVVAGLQKLAGGGASLRPSGTVLDYRVVACAERAVLHGADPYHTEPLRSCEHVLAVEKNEPAWSATPFALPPYSAALLAPFGLLPFGAGRTLWFALIVLAVCATAAALAEILDASAPAVAFVLTPTLGFLNLLYGETVPFAIAAVTLAALALQRRTPLLAAAATCLALIEPAIGLPAAVGLFLLAPAARLALLAGVGLLAAISIGTFGFARNIEYVVAFLPSHEQAELLARDQYSFTHLAYTLGAPAHIASSLGSVSYLVALTVGVFAAWRLARRLELPALIVLLPVAVSMLGGPFVHDVEITAALPAALVLARYSWFARAAVAMLAVDWGASFPHNLVVVVGASGGAAFLYLRRSSPLRRVVYTAAVAVAILGTSYALPKSPERSAAVIGTPRSPVRASDMSSVPWGWRIRLTPSMSRPDLANTLKKIPTWFALALLPLVLSGGEEDASRI